MKTFTIRNHSFSRYAKFSEKLTFLTPLHTHVWYVSGGQKFLFSGKFSIRVKWMALSWCYVSGQTLGSTHVNSVSKDHRKPPLQTSSIKDVNVKRRLAADETVFRIYKGVKTFDFSKIKNIMATGGLLIVYGVLVFWTFLWYLLFLCVLIHDWNIQKFIFYLGMDCLIRLWNPYVPGYILARK